MKRTKRQRLLAAASECGLSVAVHGVGDGVLRYRFFPQCGNGDWVRPREYGEEGSLFTGHGCREAWCWLLGYRSAVFSERGVS